MFHNKAVHTAVNSAANLAQKADVNLLPIPDSDEKALSDILPTSYHTVVDTGVKEGDVVGI